MSAVLVILGVLKGLQQLAWIAFLVWLQGQPERDKEVVIMRFTTALAAFEFVAIFGFACKHVPPPW